MINASVAGLYIAHISLLNAVAFCSLYFTVKGSAYALSTPFILCFFLFALIGFALLIDAARFLYGSLDADTEQIDILREHHLHIVGIAMSVFVMLFVMGFFICRLFQITIRIDDERKIAPLTKLMSKLTVLTLLSVVSQVCFWHVSLSTTRSIFWSVSLVANITANALFVALRLDKFGCSCSDLLRTPCDVCCFTLAVRAIRRRASKAAAAPNVPKNEDATIENISQIVCVEGKRNQEQSADENEKEQNGPDLQMVRTASVTESNATAGANT